MPRVLIGLIILASAIWYFWPQQEQSPPEDKQTARSSPEYLPGVEKPEGNSGATPSPSWAAPTGTPNAQPAICTILPAIQKSPNYETVKAVTSQVFGTPLETQNWENTHLITPKGEKIRIRIINAGEGGRKEMQLFGVDKEDLPIPKKIPSNHQFAPSAVTIAKYKSMGETKKVQSNLTLSWPSQKAVMDVTFEDGIVSEINASGLNAQFGCYLEGNQLRCRCLP